MTGLIILLILIPVVFLILIISLHSKASLQQQFLESLHEKMKQLSDQFHEFSQKLNEKEKPAMNIPKEIFEKPVTPPEVYKKEIHIRPDELLPAPEENIFGTVLNTGLITEETTKSLYTEKQREADQLAVIEENYQTDRKQGNTDLEKFIGENLANKIGIAVLVLGIAFFVKYAIDKNWIKEAGRVTIGLVCGGLLIGIAHRIRNKYRSFSSVLVGGGLTVLYFSIAFAFHQYHLISQLTAFIIMVMITALGVMLSLFYDRPELSVLATVGGFITPFLVSTGQDNYIALFTYLCILNTGLMVLAWFKQWTVINFIALFFTVVIYGGWLVKGTWLETTPDLPYKQALLFASLFFIQFVVMTIINNLRLRRPFKAFDFIVVLSINFLYYAAGMLVLSGENNEKYQGLFTASLAVFNFLLASVFYRNKKADRNFVYLLTGLTLSFASLFAPVQLEGNHITLFWAAEMVVLFWLYLRSGINLMKIASPVVAVLMLVSLFTDWAQVYFSENKVIPVVVNKGFITTLASSASLFIYFLLLKRNANTFYLQNITTGFVRNCFQVCGIIILYLAGVLEIFYQFSSRFEPPLFTLYLQLYTFAFALVLLTVFRQSGHSAVLKILFTVLCLVLYIINIPNNYDLSFTLFENTSLKFHFITHWLAAGLLFKLLSDLVVFFIKNQVRWSSYVTFFTWISAGSLILLLSLEAYHILIWTNYNHKSNWNYMENLFYKAGLTILWAVCSFVMMWLGMKNHFRPLRIISLTLFTAILIKLFTYDISNIPPGGKITAFILLGILLLVVSFMYQRLKKIIIDDKDGKEKIPV